MKLIILTENEDTYYFYSLKDFIEENDIIKCINSIHNYINEPEDYYQVCCKSLDWGEDGYGSWFDKVEWKLMYFEIRDIKEIK